MIGTYVRSHRARKAHGTCAFCPEEIRPGEVYLVGVTLPGDGRYPCGGGDYESFDWPFTVVKVHSACYDREMVGE
jgi:hypothetical protein